MLYKIVWLLCLVITTGLTQAQSLVLDKINDIPIRDGFGVVRWIAPLSKPDSIAVASETSTYDLGGRYDDVSVISKNEVINVSQTSQRPYFLRSIRRTSQNELIIFKENYNKFKEHLYLKFKPNSLTTYDSLIVNYEYYPKLLQFNDQEYIYFGRSNVNDSILLHQTVNLSNGKITLTWADIIKDRNVSLWSGRYSNELYMHVLADNYEAANNYLVYHKKNESPNIIQYNSSNPMQNEVFPETLKAYWPLALINDTTVYVACNGRREVDYTYSHRNYIVFSINLNTQQLNWQYHGLENMEFNYFKPTPGGVHLYYENSQISRYEFINSNGELAFEDDNSEIVRYCTQNDECIVYRNDTLFLKKLGEVLAYHAIENRDQFKMVTYHPDDRHHYVTLRKIGDTIMNIYQLKLDTIDTSIFNTEAAETFSLYPNPSSTSVGLELPVFQKYDLEIINLKGQVVEQYTFTGKEKTIQPKHLPQGTYWLQATGQNEKRYVSRLVWLE